MHLRRNFGKRNSPRKQTRQAEGPVLKEPRFSSQCERARKPPARRHGPCMVNQAARERERATQAPGTGPSPARRRGACPARQAAAERCRHPARIRRMPRRRIAGTRPGPRLPRRGACPDPGPFGTARRRPARPWGLPTQKKRKAPRGGFWMQECPA